jgi:hypothetical protein
MGPPEGSAEAHGARLLRAARRRTALPTGARARVRTRLLAGGPVRTTRRPAFALLAAALVLGGAVAVATTRLAGPRPAPSASGSAAAPRRAPARIGAPPAPISAPPAASTPEGPARASAPPRAPAAPRRRALRAIGAGEAPTAPTAPTAPAPAETPPLEAAPAPALPSEHGRLAEALRLLRRERDPAAALAALDRFDAEFPRAALAPEARVARIEALAALGRKREALAALDALDAQAPGPGSALRVLRGELRAAAGRCRDALLDFDAALGEPRGGLHERALYGRGVCRARLGDAAGAAADFARYEATYPAGRFADDVRGALGRPPGAGARP